MRIRRGSRPHKILKILAITSGLLVVSAISPLSGAQIAKGLIRAYFRKKRFEKEKFLRDLKNLQARKLIDYQELPNGEIKIVLTKAGKKKTISYSLDDLKLTPQKYWDGQWRMVIFDIPHYKKQARDAFRLKLNALGFYPVQKSVFITPHPCENEIDFICSIFDIRRYVLIFYVKDFEGSVKFRHHFGL